MSSKSSAARRSRPDPMAPEAAEIERLVVQARAWAADAERLLDRLGVGRGWVCADLGTGPLGILDLLSRRVGPGGRVIGVERAPLRVIAAAAAAAAGRWRNVRLTPADVLDTGLPRAGFDFVHARMVCQATGVAPLLREMIALAKPGGLIAIEEPGLAPWRIDPAPRGYQALAPLVARRFLSRAAGRGPSLAGRFRRAGLVLVRSRETRLRFAGGHPYAAMPLFALESVRAMLIEDGVLTRADARRLARQLAAAATDPATTHETFPLFQVSGRVPARRSARPSGPRPLFSPDPVSSGRR